MQTNQVAIPSPTAAYQAAVRRYEVISGRLDGKIEMYNLAKENGATAATLSAMHRELSRLHREASAQHEGLMSWRMEFAETLDRLTGRNLSLG